MSSKFTIYKASAGSGKTFRLAVEYIKILIVNPQSYKNILAVTFTNKATAEMKMRIMTELCGLSLNLDDSATYMQIICAETGLSKEKVQANAALALSFILHDYGHFKVETIDSFLQTVLRNMAKELGINVRFNVNIDDKIVLQNAIAEMIDKSGTDNVLLDWLYDYISTKLDDDKSWKIDRDIEKFYNNLISEKFKAESDKIVERLSDKNFLQNYRKKIYALREIEYKKMHDFAARFYNILTENALTPNDFKGGTSSVASYFNKLVNDAFLSDDVYNKTAQKCAANAEEWTTKTSSQREKIIDLAQSTLMPLLNDAESARKTSARIINSCTLLLENINNLGLLSDILKHINNYNSQNNLFSLSDTPALLSRMIGSDDSSFVFEKIGSTFHYIMIDEFQDTSSLQWKNFEPLLIECLSQGYGNLIVGDVKQAIYRWRNGDWNILNTIENNKNLKMFSPQVHNLTSSWRSGKNIVDFNNQTFVRIVNLLNADYKNIYGEDCEDLKTAYSDVQQNCEKKDLAGYVCVDFFEKKKPEKTYVDNVLNDLVGKIESLQAAGVKPSDMAILVRAKKDAIIIADFLDQYQKENSASKYCYTLVSNETFTLDSSAAVNIIICAMRFLQNTENSIALANLALNYQHEILRSDIDTAQIFADCKKYLPTEFFQILPQLQMMPLYELAEKIYSLFNVSQLNENSEYMFSFLDSLGDYLQNSSSDISRFLDYWDETLHEKTIETSDAVDGIRIMTIHKSKGLEFHSVILPFCSWDFVSTHKENYIWCKSNQQPFDEIGLVPIAYGKSMKYSTFSADYKDEYKQVLVDNINLLYVATTRAKANLVIISANSSAKEYSNIARVLYDVWENKNVEIGTISPSFAAVEKQSKNMLKTHPSQIEIPFESHDYEITFRQSNESRNFMRTPDDDTSTSIFADRGKLLHKIFADIKSMNDVDAVLENMQFDGIIKNEQKAELKNFINNAFENPQVKLWFSNKYKLFAECSIITKLSDESIGTKRPDRVMVGENETIVVDFKFGKQHNKYRLQLLEYMNLMAEMNYKNISGFLWYVDENRVEEVKK